jgi:hypothetical protein
MNEEVKKDKYWGIAIAVFVLGILSTIPASYGLYLTLSSALTYVDALSYGIVHGLLCTASFLFILFIIIFGAVFSKRIKKGRKLNIAGIVLGVLAFMIGMVNIALLRGNLGWLLE